MKKGARARAGSRAQGGHVQGQKGRKAGAGRAASHPLDRFLLDPPSFGLEPGPSGSRLFAFLSPVPPSGVNSAHAPRRGCDSGCDIL